MAQMYDNDDSEVSISEQGILKTSSTTKSVTADGDFTEYITVPAGKKWTLKAGQAFKSTGTYTVSNVQLRVDVEGDASSLVTISTGTTTINYLLPQAITLIAGSRIAFQVTITGYSVTGNFISRVLIQETDI